MYRIEDLYAQYKQDLFRYLLSLTHNHALSEDLLSDTFVKAIASLRGFKGNSSAKTWLFGIARNTWLQHLRNIKKDVDFDDLMGLYVAGSIDDHFIARDIVKRVKELLRTKDDRTQSIVKLRSDGLTYGKIAEKLGISENSARVIDFRTKKWLRSLLEKEGLL